MKYSIGVYLNSEPHAGGTFQYNLTIVRALLAMSAEGAEVTAIVGAPGWAEFLPGQFKVIEVKRLRGEQFAAEFLRKLTRAGRLYRLLAPVLLSAVRAINRSNCDLVVYPSQDPISFLTQKRSLCAIHDLMHRYEPQFSEYQGAEYHFREMLYSNICRYCSGILVDSEVGKRHVIESYGPPEDRVHPLPFVPPYYLLESRTVDVREKYGLPARYVFYPAQFWEHKNHSILIEAISLLKSRGLEVPLVLVGSKKNHFETVMSLIRKHGLEQQVHVLGYVGNDDMASLYRRAAALAFVSLIGPTNIPPLEAMVLDCPAIVSNRYAMPEQLGDAALFVDPASVESVADGIRSVWTDGSLRKTLVERGRRRMRELDQASFDRRFRGIVQCVIEGSRQT